MRLFVFSDVHGNVRAFDAVLASFRDCSPCGMLFLGDVVGYGAHPDACLDRLLAFPRATLVMGNHDLAVIDPAVKDDFNDDARAAWTGRWIDWQAGTTTLWRRGSS